MTMVALCGGVGAARMLRGLAAVRPRESIIAVVNTGDDLVLHGLAISPDLDTVTYTLAGANNEELGWGLTGETWRVMEALERYRGQTWFRLGDVDLATHLYRTQRLAEGAPLSTVTAEIAQAWDIGVTLVPMSDDRVATKVTVAAEGPSGPLSGQEGEISFQEYFVARAHAVPVTSVRFDGADGAHAAPGVLDAVATAERVVICPSNPIVSIGPILAVPGIEEAVADRRASVVAVSPIIAGAALKGPADRLLAELGHEPSVVGVARIYAPIAATLVIDVADTALADAVEGEGMRCVVAPTIMRGPAEAAALAEVVLS